MTLPNRRPSAPYILAVLTSLFSPAVLPAQAAIRTRPGLVVLVAVDQLRGDYLLRFKGQWTGGFARILAEGRLFPGGLQDHAITETAPGHATMLSGRNPARTGIVTNALGVADSASPLVGASGPGASPARFVGTTLFDWLRAADPGTRLLAVSRKDRAAILPVGRARGPVFWYADGRFVTSRYYADSLPTWVTEYNERQGPQRLVGTTWLPLLPDSAYAEADAMPFENGGRDFSFPHPLPGTTDSVARLLPEYPWMDSLTIDFALEGIRRLSLGTRPRPDLLVLSLSATDYIGHAFGPDSKELHDHLLRLDRWLGWFLDSLARQVPAGRTILVLTGDHGVTSFPEFAARQGRDAGRTSLEPVVTGALRALGAEPRERYGMGFDSGLITADTGRLRAAGVNVDSLAAAMAGAAARIPGVVRAYTPRTLAAAPRSDIHAGRWRRSLPPGLGWLVCAVVKPGYIWTTTTGWTTHGTSNADDVSVPIAFWGDRIRPGVSSAAARTIDIAPTLGALLGVKPLEPLDGRVLREVLPSARGRR